jgi:UDP-N-acetylmuramoyl-tripeptide--D-alanyl-D-alanine ligase
VTGSVGKTTARVCAVAALRRQFKVITNGRGNHFSGLFRAIFRVRPWHRYAILELAIDGPGQMKLFGKAVRPRIAVWVSVARTHTDKLRTLEMTAAEKSQIIESLPRGGVAILNADDPYISRYTPPERVRVIRFGTGEGCELRAIDIRSAWPERLSFRLIADSEEIQVTTQFVGKHWVPSVLAAFAVARACGLDLREAAAGIGEVQPVTGRISPAELPNGAVFLRDENNGSPDTLAAALRVMEEARAERKILVISNVSDDKRKQRQRYASFGRIAAETFDAAVFLGEHSAHSVRAAVEAGIPADCVNAFLRLEDAARFLQSEVRAGDLVLLRGTHADHLSRLYLSQVSKVECWRNSCGRRGLCDICPQLTQKPRRRSRLIRIARSVAGDR